MRSGSALKKPHLALILCMAVLFLYFLLPNTNRSNIDESSSNVLTKDSVNPQAALPLVPASGSLSGPAIASKLGNETAKAELGRATWKYFHTVFARFPDTPSSEEQEALRSWVYLFQRLYPCGECANHFGEILAKFPPQVSGRSSAAVWGCHVHNEVNKSLKKELFDCSRIGDFYDCGCAEDDKGELDTKAGVAG
ncbi:FAD-linked sulfhydryl oxidase ERV2 mitochondrial precursor [Polychaeton citri CBS 116435]|uniref:Sulfhydryl oxidase n=1 Tax=Polychaeton citri CBS 116435 TaxID=1314669 RepID=A0A9P4Q873_9PEZI|nr:FAD-linked sulfhydryl oxidase ERV2 mitochondrial precursor [Polychaeton citri CBS 116435]